MLISPDDLQSLEETLAILTAPETLRGIREGQDAIRAGDSIEGADAIAALRPKA